MVSYLVDVWKEGVCSQPIKVFQTHSVSAMPTEWQCVVESMTSDTPRTIKADPCSELSVLYGHCPRSHLHTWTGPVRPLNSLCVCVCVCVCVCGCGSLQRYYGSSLLYF